MRIAQWNILEFLPNPGHVAAEWPRGCWPKSPEPPDPHAREKTCAAFRADRAHQLYLAKYQAMNSAYPQVRISQRTLFQLQLSYMAALEKDWTCAILFENYSTTSGLARPDPRE